jgi:hypothetical protein
MADEVPGALNGSETPGDVGVRSITKLLEAVADGSGDMKVRAYEIEELTQDIGAALDPVGFLLQLVVRVDEGGGSDVDGEVGRHRRAEGRGQRAKGRGK